MSKNLPLGLDLFDGDSLWQVLVSVLHSDLVEVDRAEGAATDPLDFPVLPNGKGLSPLGAGAGAADITLADAGDDHGDILHVSHVSSLGADQSTSGSKEEMELNEGEPFSLSLVDAPWWATLSPGTY